MRNIFIFILLFSFGNTFSQEEGIQNSSLEPRDISQNELSIGALNLVAFGVIDLTYERIINSNSSWSAEVFLQALDRDSEDVSDAFYKEASLTGKYKYFFSSNYARGFYVQGFGMLSTGEYTPDLVYVPYPDSPPVDRSENYTDFALGFGIGGKFVASRGFFLDLSTGIGRNLFNENSPTIVGQFNVNLGFRF